MPEGLRRAPVPDHGRDHGRSQGQGRPRRALSRRQRPASDQQLRLHDLPRRPGLGDRLHLRLAHARHPRSRRRSGRRSYGWHAIHLWDYPMLPKRFIESSCLKCHHQVTDIPAGQEAPGRLPADRQVRLHGLPHDRRRGLVRPRPDRRAAGRARTSRTSARRSPRSGSSSGSSTRTRSGPIRGCRGSTALTNNDAQGRLAQELRRDPTRSPTTCSPRAPRPPDFVDPPGQDRPGQAGKELFLQKGCLACHQHRPYDASMVQQADRENAQPGLQARPGR